MKNNLIFFILLSAITVLIVSGKSNVQSNIDFKPIQELKNDTINYNPYAELQFNKVVAYEFSGITDTAEYQIITNGKLAPTVEHQQILSKTQINSITKTLTADRTYGGNKAFCFEPHFGIVFYLDTAVISYVSICLDCNYLISSTYIPATELNTVHVSEHYERPLDGFSKTGRQQINEFCKSLNFNHCVDTLNTVFDE